MSEKTLNVVKIPPQKTLRELIAELTKEFSEEELNSVPSDVSIMFHNNEGWIAHKYKAKDSVSIVGLIECAKSMYLEGWHERDREVIFYD